MTKATYAAIYAVDGALMPFLSVFLAYAHGLSPSQIGYVLTAASVAAVVAPPIVTVLADRYGRAERFLVVTLLASALALLGFGAVDGYWSVLVVYVVFCLAREPTRPLLDGIFFASQRVVPALAQVSYHRVRLWGTFGYMVPGLVLYVVLDDGTDSLGLLPVLSCGLAVLGVVVAWFLPTRRHARSVRELGASGGAATRGVSLREIGRAAATLLTRRRTLVFVAAMFLVQMSMAAYYAYYPLQATEVGLSPRWLGLVSNLGVALELGYVAAYGWLLRRFGWRRLMVLGAVGAGVRVALLALTPTMAVVVGTQVLHGLVIVVLMIAGRVLLDRQAPDEIRHTTQGMYAMIVFGGGRVAGSALGGLVATHSLTAVFWCATVAAAVAALLLAWSVNDAFANPPATAGAPGEGGRRVA